MPTTSETQKAFWTKLKESNPELFPGTPPESYFFDIPLEGIPLVTIRMNIYKQQSAVVEKGSQTISLVIPVEKCRMINDLFENDCKSIKDDCIIVWYKNADVSESIYDNKDWQPYIDWFVKYTQKLKDLLESWK